MGMISTVSPRVPKNIPQIENTVFAANPLLASVLRENVIIKGSRATIPLWTRWDAVFEQVLSFGPVLSIGRNAHAVLGRIGDYPKVFCAPCGHCAAAADGTMEFYFASWERAHVSVEEKPGGWLYAVEFFDAWGETLHKICLTAESDFEAFREWVEINQATESQPAASWSTRREGCAATPTPPPAEDAILLDTAVLPVLFSRLIEEKYPVQVVVGNDGFVQGADLIPLTLRTSGQWIFVSDEQSGLHLRNERLAEICLHRVRWQDNGSNLVLKIYEPEGRMACVLAPPRLSASPHWDDLLQEIAAPFHLAKNEP